MFPFSKISIRNWEKKNWWFQPQKSCLTSKVNISSSFFFEKCVFLFSRSQPIRSRRQAWWWHNGQRGRASERRWIHSIYLFIGFSMGYWGWGVEHFCRLLFHRIFEYLFLGVSYKLSCNTPFRKSMHCHSQTKVV